MSVAEMLCVKRGGGKTTFEGERWEARKKREGGSKIGGIESGLVRESK